MGQSTLLDGQEQENKDIEKVKDTESTKLYRKYRPKEDRLHFGSFV